MSSSDTSVASATPVNVEPSSASPAQKAPDTGVHGKTLALIFIGLLFAMFVSSISETIASTALPTIVGDLGGVEIMQWVTTTYILASTITMPIYGKLGDMIGRKKLLIIGLVIYTVGKIICAITPNMAFLLVGRVVSGLGGGGLIILTQAAVADITPPRTRGKYLGLMGAVFAMCTVLGPLLGGWFLEVSNWRMIFWFTVPIAAVAIVFLALFYKVDFKHQAKLTIDVPGCITMAIAVTSVILAMAWGGSQYPWDSWQILGLFGLFIVSSIAFVLIERRSKEPIIPMYLFKNRNFVLCSLAGMLIYIGLMGAVNYLPTYFQIVDKMNPIWAGLAVTPMSIALFISSTVSGFLAARSGKYKWMTIVMAISSGIGFALMATLSESQPLWITEVIFALTGFGVGIGMQILVLVVQNEFPHNIVGTATAANNFFRQIGSTMGASLVGSMFTSRLAQDLSATLPKADNISIASITPTMVDKLPDSVQQIIANGYSDALVPLFIYFVPLSVIALILMIFLKEHPLRKTIEVENPSSPDAKRP